MKSKMKRQGSSELPRFVVGALATAGASAASGATVQITFSNNVVSTSLGITNFVSDLTGDEVDEIQGHAGSGGAMIYLGTRQQNVARATMTSGSVNLAGVGGWTRRGKRGLVAFNFIDDNINNGTLTAGFLDVEANASFTSGMVQIHRLIFDDASTTAPTGVAYTDAAHTEWQVSAVPEPGSNLALLALGAGGLTLRRRLKRAA
jgi:hypothetical protein